MTETAAGLHANPSGVPQSGVPLVCGHLVLCEDPAIDRLAGPVARAHRAVWRQRRAAAEGDH